MTLLATRPKNRNSSFIFDELLDPTSPFQRFRRLESSTPPVNIRENSKSFDLELAIPGKSKDDFKIELDNDILTIFAEAEEKDEKKEDNYTRKEFGYTSFRRSFTLPETVEGSDIKAKYKEGVLRVTLPKKEEAVPKPKQLISIG